MLPEPRFKQSRGQINVNNRLGGCPVATFLLYCARHTIPAGLDVPFPEQ